MSTHPIKTPKKLIEVALPLDDINEAAIREKSMRHGHPSTLHLWWARRPLAVARAIIFAQMVNDPGYERALGRGMNKEKAEVERERLFGIIRRLVQWENTNVESVLSEAREEIWKSWRETCELNRTHPEATTLFDPATLPAFHDPFAGGGALPLEAQRLGLASFASDLNPVAVLINKSLIEVPPRFAGRQPVGPIPPTEAQYEMAAEWTSAMGLAEDVRRYGVWARDEAFRRIGNLYPQVDLPPENGGGKATVIAWIWARTVKSPNPAYSQVDVPLSSTFILSSKAGKEAYVSPHVEGMTYSFEVKSGLPQNGGARGTKAGGRGANFICLLSGTPITADYIRAEGKAGRIGARMLAVVAEGQRGRVYLPPTPEIEGAAAEAIPTWGPDIPFFQQALGFRIGNYGLSTWADLFSPRQLVALTTFSDIAAEARETVKRDAIAAGWSDDGRSLEDGGSGATAYGDAVSVYLAFLVDQLANHSSSMCGWNHPNTQMRSVFSRQALPMVWDYAEANVFSSSSGSYNNLYDRQVKAFEGVCGYGIGSATQLDASTQTLSANKVISTDPPYYDNIGYADLSDFFYVWLRRTLRGAFPSLLASMTVPKAEELVATPHRHGGAGAAEKFFLDGMTQAMRRLADQSHPAFPTTIYYAFKQSDTTDVGTGNTGWETFLEAVLRAGFALVGTWPVNTEKKGRTRDNDSNALSSSIVLVCRKRDRAATTVSRRDFLRELKEELAGAVEVMIGGSSGVSPVAPVDLAQAVIGPGMGIFSKYAAVLEADGAPMSVHVALTLINRMLTEGADDFDADTHFCLGWFDELGWSPGEFGRADVLARAKGTSVNGVVDAGVVEAAGGNVRLLRPTEYANDWTPSDDNRTPVWEALHQLIRVLRGSGESAAGGLLADMPQRAEPIRNLAYRLYTLCERKRWADDARAYNELITSWSGIEEASHEKGHLGSQTKFDI
jgi:putative DNA methylase